MLSKERQQIILEIALEKKTTILYESRYKLIQLLQELSEACGKERPIQIARELTKLHEEYIGPTISSALDHFKNNEPRGEFTIILGGNDLPLRKKKEEDI